MGKERSVMTDKDLFDLLDEEINKTRQLFIQNEKNLQAQEKKLKEYLESDTTHHLEDDEES